MWVEVHMVPDRFLLRFRSHTVPDRFLLCFRSCSCSPEELLMFCYAEAVPKRSQCKQKQFWYTFYKVSFHYPVQCEHHTRPHSFFHHFFGRFQILKTWTTSHDAFSYTQLLSNSLIRKSILWFQHNNTKELHDPSFLVVFWFFVMLQFHIWPIVSFEIRCWIVFGLHFAAFILLSLGHLSFSIFTVYKFGQ